MSEWLAAWLVEQGVYVLRQIDGIAVAEPREGRGPAYAQDPETGVWEYLYDVAVGTAC
jgi:hypothetical protein